MFSRASLRSLAKLASNKPTATWQKYQSNWLVQMKYAQIALTFQSANRFATKQKQKKKKEPTVEEIKQMVGEFYKPYHIPGPEVPPVDWENLAEKLDSLNQERTNTEESDFQYRKALKDIELAYLEDVKTPRKVSSSAIIELGYVYGSLDFGSQRFWSSLVTEFKSRLEEYHLELIARFLDGASHKVILKREFWETLTDYFRANPHDVPLPIICYLLPTIIRTFRQQDLPQETVEHEGQEGLIKTSNQLESAEDSLDFIERIREDELWNILKDSAIEQIRDCDSHELAQIAWSFSAVQYQDQGLWATIYELYRGFRDEYDANTLSTFTEIFATMNCGDRGFWEDMETFTLANIREMDIDIIIDFMRGFSKKEEGSFKLWNEFTEQIFSRDLNPEQLSSVVKSFADYELLSQSNWEILENKILESLEFFSSGNLVHVIMGFGKSEKGSQNLWDKIEGNLLNEQGTPLEAKLALYTVLKSCGKLTPALANHYESVAEDAEEILEQMREYNEVQQQDRYV